MDTNRADIKGYEGLYAIFSDGRVWSYPKKNGPGFRRGHWMKGYVSSNGYKMVSLCKNAKYKHHIMHRLLALAFIPNPLNKEEVNHKNGRKLDNRLENLEWLTPSENSQHAYDIGIHIHRGLKGERNGRSKLTIKKIKKIRAFKGILTYRELAKKYNVSLSVIWSVMNRKSWIKI